MKPYSPVVSDVVDCVVPATETVRACRDSDPVAPAKAAGVQEGDRIVSFNGTPFTTWEDLQDLIRANEDGVATIVVQRNGQDLVLTTNTTVTARPTSQTDETLTQVGFLGVSPTFSGFVSGGPLYTLDRMGVMTKDTLAALGTLPAKVFDVGQAIVGLEERDPNGPVSIVGGSRFAGETVAEESFPVKEKAVFLLMLIAGFNFFIGMFNFIPLLPLDGGHIAGALWEGLRRAGRRLRGRPDPGYVDVAQLLPVAYCVAGVMLAMGIVLIVGDLVVPVACPT